MKRVIYLFILLLATAWAGAEPVDSVKAPQISLLTCAPGREVYELCGHTGLRVRHADTGIDYTVNYGLFDFEAPNFLYRFVKGDTDYMVGAYPTAIFVNSYVHEGRKVTEQILDLTTEQAVRLESMLIENMAPANRVYRYNYVKNNCATKPVDMIERAIGDSIRFVAVQATEPYSTFREEMTYFHSSYPWYQLGIDMALGSGLDYPMSEREKMFAPEALCAMMASATIGGRRVVVSERLLNDAPSASLAPTPWYFTPKALFWVVFVLALCLQLYDLRRHSVSRWFDTVFFSLCGIVGSVIFFLVFFSEHEATSPNWLLVALNPLCFAGAILPWTRLKTLRLIYFRLNFWAVLLLVVLWPFTDQHINGALLPLAMIDMMRSGYYIMLIQRIKWAR